MPWFRASMLVAMAMLAAVLGTVPGRAQQREVPYWASLRHETVNMRVGPSAEYPISWVFRRQGLPVKVVRLREGWRLVEDVEGAQGWIAQSQLDPRRGVMVVGEGLAVLHAEPAATSPTRWRAEPGVVARLLRCKAEWCEVDAAGRKGWIARGRLWGADDLPGDE